MCDVLLFNKPTPDEWIEMTGYAKQFQARGLFCPQGVFKEKGNENNFPTTPPDYGIIHCRVPTSGPASLDINNHPFIVNSKFGKFVGCQTGYTSKEALKDLEIIPKGKCDSEMAIIGIAEKKPLEWFKEVSTGQIFWENKGQYYTINASWEKVNNHVAIATSVYGTGKWDCNRIIFKDLSQRKVDYDKL
jgi:hypothetical protein